MGTLSFIGFDLVPMIFVELSKDPELGDAIRLGLVKVDWRCCLEKGTQWEAGRDNPL